jgi:uncharacterized protein (DUF2342 family)
VSSRIVDWQLAERIGVALAGDGPSWDGPGPEALGAECERAVHLVRRYTGLRPKGKLPRAELIGRDEWVRTNLESFRLMSEEVESKLAERISVAGQSGGGVSATLAGAAAGAEIGLATGYLGQRVVGQYDVALIGPAREPRLLFVGANLSAARERLGVEHGTGSSSAGSLCTRPRTRSSSPRCPGSATTSAPSPSSSSPRPRSR